MWYDEEEMWKNECTLDISIKFDFGKWIRYQRENTVERETGRPSEPWDVVLNLFKLNKDIIESIHSIDEFWEMFKLNKLYTLYADHETETIDMDKAMANLATRFGEDYLPDGNTWYELSDGRGLKNENLRYYFQNWKEDQFSRYFFYEEYKFYLKFGKPINIKVEFWTSYSEGLEYTYEIELEGHQLTIFENFDD